MKKIMLCLLSFSMLSTFLVSTTNVYASTNSENSSEYILDSNVDEELSNFANLKIDDLIKILELEGIDPYTVFTQDQIDEQRLKEMLRAGVNKIVKISNNTRDVYINSYIATTLKYVGFAAIGKYISGWSGIAVGAVGANISTSKGIIVRYQKQNGANWGVNGYVWVIKGVRSQ